MVDIIARRTRLAFLDAAAAHEVLPGVTLHHGPVTASIALTAFPVFTWLSLARRVHTACIACSAVANECPHPLHNVTELRCRGGCSLAFISSHL